MITASSTKVSYVGGKTDEENNDDKEHGDHEIIATSTEDSHAKIAALTEDLQFKMRT